MIKAHQRSALLIFSILGFFIFGMFVMPGKVWAWTYHNDYDFGDIPPGQASCSNYGPCISDTRGFYKWECTSFVSWRMNRDRGVTAAPWSFVNYQTGPNGNTTKLSTARYWKDNAIYLGYSVNGTPRIGDVAWWGVSTATPNGHVAYVERVYTDGSVDISEYNWNFGNGKYNERHVRADAYIHFNIITPKLTAPANNVTIYSPKFDLTWTKSIGATKYEIYVDGKLFTTTTTNKFTMERGDIIEREQVYWKVRGVYPDGQKTPFSAEWHFFFLPNGDVASASSASKLVQAKINLDNTVSVRYLEAATGEWSAWQNNSFKASGTPSLVFFKGTFYMGIRAVGGQYYMRTSANGKDWGAFTQTVGSGRSDLAMAVINNTLVQTAKRTDDTFATRYSSDGINWSNWTTVNMPIAGNPSLAVFGNKLVQVVYKADGYIYARYTTDGINWTGLVSMGSSRTLRDPALVEFNGKLYISVVGASTGKIFIASTTDAVNWGTFERTELVIKGSPSLGVLGNKLIQSARRASDDHVMVRFTKDGISWSDFYENGGTYSTPSFVTFNNTIYQTLLGTSLNKWWMRSSTNGKGWTEWAVI